MPRLKKSLAIAVSTLLLVSAGFAQQASITSVPNLIRYGGALKDEQGAAVASGTTGVTFAIYKQQDGGAPVWMETQNVTTDAGGNYSVLLGSTTATGLPSDLFSQQEQRWLGVEVEGPLEQPRVLLVSVPYALKAHEAETLSGRSISDFVLANDADSSAVSTTSASQALSSTTMLATGAAGKTGAASQGPTNFSGSTTDQIVGVTQTGTGAGVNATAPVNAVVGTATASNGNALYGVATGTGGFGMLGVSSASSGGGIGVEGNSSSTSGTGVLGIDKATTGSTIGVATYVNSPAGTAAEFNNAAGGKIISGQNNGVEKFSVDGSGNVNAAGTFTGSGAGLTGILFSNLSGSLGSSQFSGVYSNPVTLSSTSNVYYGNGSNLTGIVPGAGSPYYIQNGTSQQASANFNISGNGTSAGTLAANLVNSATSYQIDGLSVLSVGKPIDDNLFLGLGAGTSNVAGSGVANTFSGALAGLHNTTGAYNTFSGTGAGFFNTTGTNNTFYGDSAGLGNTTGSENTFYGDSAGESNITGTGNTFYGALAGSSNTTACCNDFSGYKAGFSNTIGSFNAFAGYKAGYSNTAGQHNTFNGYQAGYDNVGDASGAGSDNTFSGFQAGYNNNVHVADGGASDNTFYGYQAGYNNTGGFGNTFSGYQAGLNNTTGSSDIYIGNAGPTSGTESSAIRIGTPGNGPGMQNATYIAGIYGSTSSSGIEVYVNSIGQLGTHTSSISFKEQVRDMGDSTNALMKLRPVTFLYKPEYDDGSHTLQYGLIAEEVAEVYPELVVYDNNGQPYTVRYQYITTMLLNEVQKQYHRGEAEAKVITVQQEQIDAQHQQMNEQEQKIDDLVQRLSRLERLVSSQPQTVAQK